MTQPFAPKPSILDRVLGRLIPTNQYGDVLSPTETKAIRSQGLIGLGTGILAQGGPGTGPLQAFGKAYQGLDIPGMAGQALKLQQYKKLVTDQKALEDAAASVQRQPGESDYDYLSRKAAATAGLPGADRLSSILDALKQPMPREPMEWMPYPAADEQGRTHIYWLNKRTKEISETPLGPIPRSGAAAAKAAMSPGELRAAEQVAVALRNMQRLYKQDRTAAETSPEAAALEGAGHIPFIGGALKGILGPAGQKARTEAQQEFQRNAVALRHHYAALLPHTRMALGLLEDINKSMVPPPGTDPDAIASGFAPAWDTTLQQIEEILGTSGPKSETAKPKDEYKARHPDNPY